MSVDAAPGAAGSALGALARASRLLLIRLRSLGDAILTLPLLEALRDWRPELQLDILVESPYESVFLRHPAVHEILVMRPKFGPAWAGWSKARAAFELARRRYPVVLNLHGGPTSAMLTLASGAQRRIGQQNFRQAWVYNTRMPLSSEVWGRSDLHTVEHQLTLMRWLGLPVPGRFRYGLTPGEAARASVRERLRAAGLERGGYIHIHPTATLPTKQWPEENFAAVADALVAEYGVPAVFTAGPEEAQVLVNAGRSARHRYCYWSDLGLEELFALIESCRLFVGNDSGPTHAAAALGRPIVVVWGSSNPIAWRPWSEAYELVGSSLPCVPCPGYSCAVYGRPLCILEVAVDRVLEACRKQLTSR